LAAFSLSTGERGLDVLSTSGVERVVLPNGVPSEAMKMAPVRISVGGSARAPWGWTDFCKRYAGECDFEPLSPSVVVFDEGTRAFVERVNAAVNGAIVPRTDVGQWGIAERWDLAETGIGDCEDYVLIKQRWLASAGLPRQALLVTVVTDLAGDGHAVLTLRTDRGDFILDNMHNDVKLWRETPYGFVKSQSQANPNEWVWLDGRGGAQAIVSR
jgi:predicted transglutaminase-like cysteine proteinase